MEKVLLCCSQKRFCGASSYQWIFVLMKLEPGRPLNRYAQGTNIVAVYLDIHTYELERKVGEDIFTKSSKIVLITIWDQMLGLE